MKRIFCALLAGALTLGAALPVQAADKAVLRVAADAKQTAISDHLYGAFIEDISYACDGGLVSNLVNNDSFEYASAPTTGWVADGLELTTEGNLPLNKNNPTYAKVTVDGKGSLTNLGFTEIYKYKTDKYDKKKANTADMGFVADQVYDFSCYVRSGGFTGTAQVYLDCGDGKQTAVQLDLSKTGGAWNKLTVPLTASASKDGALVFQLEGEGTLYLDFVTLVPQGPLAERIRCGGRGLGGGGRERPVHLGGRLDHACQGGYHDRDGHRWRRGADHHGAHQEKRTRTAGGRACLRKQGRRS